MRTPYLCGGCGRPFEDHKTSEVDACRMMATTAGRPYLIAPASCPKCGHGEAEPCGGVKLITCLKCQHSWNPEVLP